MLIRTKTADIIEWMQNSEDLLYAFKLTLAGVIVIWPALVPDLNLWYSLDRGSKCTLDIPHRNIRLTRLSLVADVLVWAVLQLAFVFEVAIGTSFNSFFLRAIGTTIGSLWGWAAYEAGCINPVVCVTMLFIGLITAVYVQLGSKYPKVGQVSIVSLAVVALSTELKTVPDRSKFVHTDIDN